MPTREDLRYFQSMPLEIKVSLSNNRFRSWVREFGTDGVYISFSGGKDSTVLADMYARFCQVYGCKMHLVFVNTGLEYPEIQKFVKTFAEWLRNTYSIEVELTILRPKMRFDEVIKKYGYPIISKEVAATVWYAKKGSRWALDNLNGLDKNGKTHSFKRGMYTKYKPLCNVDFDISDKCCLVMKEKPIYEIEKHKKPITAIMASESKKRESAWLRTGCNAFDGKKPMSKPMSFWTEQDVLQYIKKYNIPIASVYGDIVYSENQEQMRIEEYGIELCGHDKLKTTMCDRTGCMFCAFGCHLEKGQSRFQRLKETHPRQYEYCICGGEYDGNGVWKPNKKGLGLGHVFDTLNEIYGDGFIKY